MRIEAPSSSPNIDSPALLDPSSVRVDLSQRWDLLRGLVRRNLTIRYKRSTVGIAWTLLNPIIELALFYLVFHEILTTDIPHFVPFLFTGILVCTWTFEAWNRGTAAIVTNRALVRQPGFPLATLPLIDTVTEGIHFLLALPVLLLFLGWEGLSPGPALLVLPLLLGVQFIFTVSFSLLLAALNVTYRDTQHTVAVLLKLLFYASGVFFDVESLDRSLQILLGINPMVHLVTAYRRVLLHGALPDWLAVTVIGLAGLVMIPVFYRYFVNQRHRFLEEL